MDLNRFLEKIKSTESIAFNDTIAVIDANYNFSPTAFTNGNTHNEAGQNSGSCKLFSFAQRNKLNKEQTLKCFGNFYADVLNTPDGNDHQNIRNFMNTGWEGISFEGKALTSK